MILETSYKVHLGAAAEGLQTFYFPIPEKARVLHYAYYVSGTNAALTNAADLFLFDNEASLNGVLINAAGSIFNNGATNSGAGTVVAIGRATHLRWQVRSANATPNTFLLRIGWADV